MPRAARSARPGSRDDDEERELDEADVFVEGKTNRFLAALGLPPLQ